MPTAAPEVLQGRSLSRRERRAGTEYELDQGYLAVSALASLTFADLVDTAQSSAQESRSNAAASAETLVSASGAAAESIVSSSTASRETLVS